MEEEFTATPNEAVSVNPKAVYNFAVKALDIDSVLSISDNVDAMHMQALVVLERILARGHPETSSGLRYCAVRYTTLEAYQRCIDMWKYALGESSPIPRFRFYLDDLCELGRAFWKIYKRNPASFRVVDVYDVLRWMIRYADELMSPLAARTNLRREILHWLFIHLVHLLCCLTLTDDETSTFRQLLRELIQTRLRTVDGQTLLHLAVNPGTYVEL